MNEINTENIEWYGLIDDEKLIACCSTEKNTDLLGVVEYTLGRVMVDPTKRRQKLGSVMIEQCITEMKRTDKKFKIRLEVLKENEAAIALYRNMGFGRISERDNTVKMERIVK